MKKILLLTVFAFTATYTFATIRYVKPSATGNGTSWANASGDLQNALLSAAASGDSIWVAAGTYKPTTGIDRTKSFVIPSGVKIYGGFVGIEPSTFNLELRDFNTSETILSGDIGTSGQSSDNSYHVVYTQNVSLVTTVDGFTIQDGNASNGSLFPEDRGGGWFNTGRGSGNSSNPFIRNIIFKNNHALLKGGALCNDGYLGNASPLILKCMFINNTSHATTGNGGAIYNEGLQGVSSPGIVDCIFTDNQAFLGGAIFNDGENGGTSSSLIINTIFRNNTALSKGGAIYNNGSGGNASPSVLNSLLTDNSAVFDGGAMFNNGRNYGKSSPNVNNVTFVDNTASYGGVMYSDARNNGNVTLNIRNCIIWGNTTLNRHFTNYGTSASIANSIVPASSLINLNLYSADGFFSATNMIYGQDPLFVDVLSGNYQLRAGSPAINSGDNGVNALLHDLVGNDRNIDGRKDIGALENQQGITKYYVKYNAYGGYNGSSWAYAYKDLQDALAIASPTDTIWVAKGTYKPATASRDSSFVIPDSVKVYGGFVGNEATNYNLDLRNFVANETILSGDIGSIADSTDNSYHVVYTKNVSHETVVDGITITRGNANGTTFLLRIGAAWFNDGSGSGNSSNPTLTNCTFTSNTANSSGGAIFNYGFNGGTSNPTLSNCTFTSNTANNDGGAMYNDGRNGTSNPTLTNCTFTSNTAYIGGAMLNWGIFGTSNPTLTNCTFTSNTANSNGGAMYNYGNSGTSSPTLTNCTFTSNTANDEGGAMYNYGRNSGTSNPTLTNCTFTSNTANNDGGAMYNDGRNGTSNPTLTNCILWNNMVDTTPNSFYNDNGFVGNATVAISYSLVQEADCNALDVGYGSVTCVAGMIYNQDPLFVNASNGILNLKCNSPAINAGLSTGAPQIDITGFARTGNPDMGAYEFGHAEVENDIASGANPILNGTPYIKASSKILNTNNALYQGALFVEMLPGFEVAPVTGAASVFRAEIGGGCSM